MNKRFATLGLLAGLSALSTGALAYQFEASGFYFDFDDLDDSALAVEGAYFFAPVDDEGIPRAEAAFLGQASNIGLGFATVDEADEDILFFGGELYLQQFYAAAGLTRIEVGNTESDDLSLEVGFVPAKGLRLTAGYDNDDLLDLSRISLNAKMVRPLSGQQAFNAEFTVGKTDELGAHAIEDRMHVKKLHATILTQLGLDPNRLSFFFNGLDQRLVGVEGAEPIRQLV